MKRYLMTTLRYNLTFFNMRVTRNTWPYVQRGTLHYPRHTTDPFHVTKQNVKSDSKYRFAPH